MKTYAYARVSTRDQNLDRQFQAFRDYGVDDNFIYADKKSGKNFDRTAYKKLLKKIKTGDLLVIKSIDRLGRNYDMIIEEWARITGTIGADILVLDMPLLDTRTKEDSLVGKFISDVVLQVLSFVSQNERENIKARQAEGIKLALQNGVRFGRPQAEYSETFLSMVVDYRQKKITSDEVTHRFGISRQNLYYHVRRMVCLGLIPPIKKREFALPIGLD